MNMLEVSNLSISFGGLKAVSEFNLTIKKRSALRSYWPQRRRKDHSVQYADRRLQGRHRLHYP